MLQTEAFQSLLQLAVAINIGYAALASFQGSSLSREVARIDALVSSAKLYFELALAKQIVEDDARATFQQAVELRNDSHLASVHSENFYLNICRWAAVVSAVVAFLLLVYATYASGNTAATWFQVMATASCVPFVILMLYALYTSLSSAAPLAKRRKELDDKICIGLMQLRPET